MSLFDVLRYPISDPPTVEELEALPEELYNNWLRVTPYGHYLLLYTTQELVEYLTKSTWSGYATCHLHEAIRNYDDIRLP